MARKFGVAALNKDPTAYADTKFVTVPTVDAPRAPTTLDVNYPIQTIWRERDPNDPTFFCEWILIGFDANGAQWRLLVCSTGPSTMLSIETDDGAPNVIPDAMGEIQIFGGAGIDVTGQGPGKTVTVSLAGGGLAVDSFDVDFATVPGVDPVTPTALGLVSVFGNTVLAGTNANAPVATHTRALNQFHIDVQLSSAVTASPADPFDAGLCSFDDTQFTVDANGFVQALGGGGPMIQTLTGDDAAAVGPDGAGNIDIQGVTVANATNAKPLFFDGTPGSNLMEGEIQVSTAIAAAPGDKNDAGLSSFDSAVFTVDTDGFVELLSGIANGEFANIGFDLTSGRFQITQADGSALSASMPGLARVSTKGSLGQTTVVKLTKPYKIDDDSHATLHDLEGWHPFWDAGDDWNVDRPYYIYVIAHDTPTSDPAVAISQQPNAVFAPAAGTINVSGTINSDVQESFLLFEISDGGGGWTTPTIANYDGNPCVCIGSIRMQVTDTANDDQTIQALNFSDGPGKYQEGVRFTTASGTIGSYPAFFATDPGAGGDISFNNGSCFYYLKRDGWVFIQHEWNGAATVSTNTDPLELLLPYYIRRVNGDQTGGRFRDSSTSARQSLNSEPSGGTRILSDLCQHGGTAPYQNDTIDASDSIGYKFSYLAFSNE